MKKMKKMKKKYCSIRCCFVEFGGVFWGGVGGGVGLGGGFIVGFGCGLVVVERGWYLRIWCVFVNIGYVLLSILVWLV